MKFLIEKFCKKPKLRNPILIEGLPGVGNVARIAVSYLASKLNAQLYLALYSYIFPNSVFVNEDSTIDLPKVEFYFWKNPKSKRDLLLVSGDYQPGSGEESYLLAEKILDIAQDLNVKEIITLGGFPVNRELTKIRIYGAVTDKNYIKEFSKFNVIFDGTNGVNLIIGAAGLLLGLGKLRGMRGISLLAETRSLEDSIGIRSSKELLVVLSKYLGLNISFKELDNEIRRIEKQRGESKRRKRKREKLPTFRLESPRYIG